MMTTKPTRRAFCQHGSLLLLGTTLATSPTKLFADDGKRKARLGLVTDLHYADKPSAGSRHYRETLAKLGEAAGQFEKDQPEAIVELGDFIDRADGVDTEKKYLARINKEFAALPGAKHYVLGNHCVDTLTKDEFLGGVEQKRSHYSFDIGGVHFVILDACFRADGKPYGRKNSQWHDANIPAEQIQWLKGDLESATGKAIIFTHQRLDVAGQHSVKNAAQVRKVLEDSGKVLAVFQGHSHKNDLQEIAGIHYCVLAAMVEGSGVEHNGYSTLDVLDDGAIRLSGFRVQKGYDWS